MGDDLQRAINDRGPITADTVYLKGHPAQRLWVLERRESAAPSTDQQVCRFVGAVAILADTAVYVVFVRSPERHRAGDLPLGAGNVRLDVERDAFKFATLDDAMTWTDLRKEVWLRRGWSETPSGEERQATSRGVQRRLADQR